MSFITTIQDLFKKEEKKYEKYSFYRRFPS